MHFQNFRILFCEFIQITPHILQVSKNISASRVTPHQELLSSIAPCIPTVSLLVRTTLQPI